MKDLPTGYNTFEDGYSRGRRWIMRVVRPIRWKMRGFLALRRTILVELRWRLGDEIMALPVLAALQKRYSRDTLVLWTNHPELMGKADLGFALNVYPQRVDRYILLRGADRRIPRQTEYAKKAGIPVPAPITPILIGDPSADWLARLPTGGGPLLALAPGASWPNKRWPVERWAILAQRLQAAGMRVFLLGKGDSAPSGDIVSFIGETSTVEAGQLLRKADLLVCCDSGLMHLALAVGTPVLALFGPTSPEFLTSSPFLHPISQSRPCAGFWNRADQVPAPGLCACGYESCLESISVDPVFKEVQRLVGSIPTHGG